MILRRPHNDVSAVVLTRGEATTQAAIDCLHRQSLPPADIIVVRDVAPFHKAMNFGARQVKTRFFIQVDADMLLDRDCVAMLRNGVRGDTGIVIGRLRDALIGQVVGAKLFRTRCFEQARFRDSISPDTDFYDEIAQAGWETVYVGALVTSGTHPWITFGEHRPAYTRPYTYRKFTLEGCRYRYLGNLGGFRWSFDRLTDSAHPSALTAQIALARGVFLERNRDLLGVPAGEYGLSRVDAFVDGGMAGSASGTDLPPDELPLDELFRRCYRNGSALFEAKDVAAFRHHLARLAASYGKAAWIGQVGLCRGLFADRANESAIAADYASLREFVAGPDLVASLDAAGAGAAIRMTADHRTAEVDSPEVVLDAIHAYALEVGLKSFVLDGPEPAEYGLDPSTAPPTYRKTARVVRTSTKSIGRPRIAAPFRLLGHVMCTEPENAKGLYWCGDLLRSGYAFIHLPTALGPAKLSLLDQLTNNVLDRAIPRRQASAGRRRGKIAVASALRQLARQRSPAYRPEPGCILMVVGDLGRGGSERQTLAAVTGLMQRGYDVRLMMLSRSPADMPTYEDNLPSSASILGKAPIRKRQPRKAFDGCGRSVCCLQAVSTARMARRQDRSIGMAIRQYRPQVVHGWLDAPGLAAALAGTGLGVPRVVVQHGSVPLPDWAASFANCCGKDAEPLPGIIESCL